VGRNAINQPNDFSDPGTIDSETLIDRCDVCVCVDSTMIDGRRLRIEQSKRNKAYDKTPGRCEEE
jgi:hypothetical protein